MPSPRGDRGDARRGRTTRRRLLDELVVLERKRADLAAVQRVDCGMQHRFVATEALRAGARLDALRAFGRAIAAGDAGAVPRAAGVLLPTRAQEATSS